MVALKKMQVVISGLGQLNGTYYFMSNPLLYASIGSIVGITPAIEPSKVIHRTEDLSLYGVLETIAVTVGTTPLNRRTVKLYCNSLLAKLAEKALIGKTIPQGVITGVSQDLKAQEYLA
ncbi:MULTISPECIES: hypothetical protein [unclassified Microcoleus]|uniref:hypothetical protein n=1 Tax=unclassified Microcoleus TaxID=2642155 RepID=UPI002FD7509F